MSVRPVSQVSRVAPAPVRPTKLRLPGQHERVGLLAGLRFGLSRVYAVRACV